ncbi:MAG: ComF family protein [Tyzzerella sp.]|nr:ComF family protein [Tyzzerella sp.]
MNLLYKVYDKCLRVLYPQTCYFCGKICRTPICKDCLKKVTYIKEPRCKKCGKPVRYAEQEYCQDCKKRETAFEQGKSIWLHKGPVTWSIYQFKYHNRRIFGEFYAKELWRLYGKNLKNWNIDVIVPVPLHWKRKRVRGYNQAEIIAHHLGRLSGIPVNAKAVQRVRYTRPQKELNDKERKKNLKEAFQITKHWKKVPHVLIVDDIYTTGNTIDAAARVLRQNGAEKIWFLTISIGQGF